MLFLKMQEINKILLLSILTTLLGFTSSETFSNPTKDLQKWCEVPNVENGFGLRIMGSSELYVGIRQFPFMATYGFLKGTFIHILKSWQGWRIEGGISQISLVQHSNHRKTLQIKDPTPLIVFSLCPKISQM